MVQSVRRLHVDSSPRVRTGDLDERSQGSSAYNAC